MADKVELGGLPINSPKIYLTAFPHTFLSRTGILKGFLNTNMSARKDNIQITISRQDFPGGAVVKNLSANARDARCTGSIPGSSPWGRRESDTTDHTDRDTKRSTA